MPNQRRFLMPGQCSKVLKAGFCDWLNSKNQMGLREEKMKLSKKVTIIYGFGSAIQMLLQKKRKFFLRMKKMNWNSVFQVDASSR